MQVIVALSTIEAKLMAVMEAMKEVLLLRGLYSEFVNQEEVTVTYCDSQSAIHPTKNLILHERTKHIK